MKYTKTLLAAAALVASVGVNAQTVTFAAPSAGSYTAPTPSFSSGTVYTASTSIANVQTQPLFDTGTFLVVDPDGQATFNLGGVQSFSFLWGSPDPTNAISINGGAFMSRPKARGAELHAMRRSSIFARSCSKCAVST